jgi:3-dehydroquinate synthase
VQEVKLNNSRMFVWPGVHAEAGENVRVLAPEAMRIFVLTDRGCVPIARRVAMSLQQSRFDVSGGAVPGSKGPHKPMTQAQVAAKLEKLGPEGVGLVAVGGTSLLHLGARMAGDRPFFLVPTTLRAQLDAAIGGSTCPMQGGRWRPARAVFSDPTLLATLPLREFIAGLAEAVKCAVIQDPDLFDFLRDKALAIRDRERGALEDLVFRAATVKAAAVDSSTPGPGARATFRYGHLVGGALEKLAGAAVLHGEALAVGMEAEAFVARKLGWADDEVTVAQNKMLKSFGLPTRAKGVPPDALAAPLLAKALPQPDLPDAIGHAKGPAPLTPELLKAAVAAVTK